MSRSRTLALFPLVLATLGSAAPAAWAAWPSNPNSNVPLCTAPGIQLTPVIVSDGAGGAIAAWGDRRSGTASDIYTQRVNAAGVLIWPDGGYDGIAICAETNNQERPTIVSDGAGGAIVTWYDTRSGAGADIYAQRINGDGVTLWTPGGVALCTSPNDQLYPAIASDGAGGAIVTWQDARGGATISVYAQRVDATGVPRWTANGVALCAADSTPGNNPTIVSDGARGAIVTWQDYRGGTNYNIYAQRVDSVGVPQWTADGVALCTAAGNQIHPKIASDGAGGAIVTWQDYRGGTASDIYAQRVNAAGVPQWTADGAALCTAANDQYEPVIISDGAGGAIVAWPDLRSFPLYNNYAQRVNSAGVPQWTANGVALSLAGSGSFSAIVSDGAGGAIVAWEDFRNGNNNDIYAQRVNPAGVVQWNSNGVAICTAAYDQSAPTITSNMAGGAIITWHDGRNDTDDDIYAQNINADGTLGGTLLSAPGLSASTSFGLHGVQPNPSFGDLRVPFSLLDSTPAMLELYDLTGRRIESISVGGLGPGSHVTSFSPRAATLPAGVYCVSLTQGRHRAFKKVAIVR